MADDASMAPGQVLRPITNGLHQDHSGIRRVRHDPLVRVQPLSSTVEPIATNPYPSYSRAFAWVVALLVVAGSALAFSSSAEAAVTAPAVPCWKKLLNDWYDGRIDNAYPVRCYRQAIRELPEDVQVYADAEADIRRALLAALRQSKKTTGKPAGEETPVKPPSQPTSNRSEDTPAPPAGDDGPGGPGPTGEPIAGPETLTTGAVRSADSLPLPLLVLGALALLLLTAAGAGVVNKRLQARRVAPPGPAGEEPPPVA